MLRLHITPAEGEPFDHEVETDSLIIGRSTRCELAIADRFLSRQHARMYRTEAGWVIEDLESRNGTFVNGKRVEEPTSVSAGDVIAMSASLIRVLREADEYGLDGSEISSTSDVLLRPASDVLIQVGTPPPEVIAGEGDALSRYAKRLSIVNEVHQALARSIALDELLELILDRAFEQLEPEQGVIFLRDPQGRFQRAASRTLPGSARGLKYSESLIHEVAEKGMAALVLDTQTDERFAEAKSLLDAGLRSLVAAPLLDQPEGTVGLIVLGSNAAVRRFSEEDLELLVTLASVAAMRIRNLALAEEAAERRRLEHELDIARRIQVALLPATLPALEGYQVYAASNPSRRVSGDYYEVVLRAEGKECALLVADVAGKGIAASLLTGYLEALASVSIENGLAPHEVFERVSDPLYRRTPANRFATFVLTVLELASGRLQHCSAGHVPAFVVRASGEVEWLEAHGLPLGLLEDSEYSSEETVLRPGDTLVLYSDGYTEAENPAEEQFGEERLAEACVAHRTATPDDLARAIDGDVERFTDGKPAADDRTIVILRRVEG